MSEYTEFIEGIPVHPHATTYPMMNDEDLQALADDIKENGQREPIVLAHMDGVHDELVVVIDGRNRFRACQIAGVEPEFRTDFLISGDAIVPWIDSKNAHRRHMTREQRRARIEQVMRQDPSLPDYQIAKRVGASPHTVKRVREANPDLQVANEERVNARGQVRPATYIKNEADEVLEARARTDRIKAEGAKLTGLLGRINPGGDVSGTVPAVLGDRWVFRAIQLGSLTPMEALMSALRLQNDQPPTTDDEHSIDLLMCGLLTRTGRWINGFNPDIPLPEAYENWAGEEHNDA